jgi:ribosomal protein S27AE
MHGKNHLPGSLVTTPPWDHLQDPNKECSDCGHEFAEHEERFEDPRGNPICGTCRAKHPCKVCRGAIPKGLEGDTCSDLCDLMAALQDEELIEADHNYRMKVGA